MIKRYTAGYRHDAMTGWGGDADLVESKTGEAVMLQDVKTLITDAYTEGFKAGASKDLASHPDEYTTFALMQADDEA